MLLNKREVEMRGCLSAYCCYFLLFQTTERNILEMAERDGELVHDIDDDEVSS